MVVTNQTREAGAVVFLLEADQALGASAAPSDGGGVGVIALPRPGDAPAAYLAQAATGSEPWLIQASRRLAMEHVARLRIGVYVVPFSSTAERPEIAASLVLEGALSSGRFTLERASASHDWDRVNRWLAEPFARLEGRVFPPPELSLRVGDPREAERLMAASAETGVRCETRGSHVHCIGDAAEPQSLRRYLRRVAARVSLPTGASVRAR
jgi:hypothetical protein